MDLLIPLGYLLSVCRFVPITYSTVQSLEVLNLQFVWVSVGAFVSGVFPFTFPPPTFPWMAFQQIFQGRHFVDILVFEIGDFWLAF